MSALHDEAHAAILARLLLLEGATPPPNPNPTPSPPPSASLIETINMQDIPASVAITRSGGTGTRIGSFGAVAIEAANVARYEWDTNGTFLGLWVERAHTNLVTNARNPGAVFSALGSGVTTTITNGASAESFSTQV